MNQIISEVVGRVKINKPAILTVVAENFSLIEDEAIFIRATLSIPEVTRLPFTGQYKTFVQLGDIHSKLKSQLEKTDWNIIICDTSENLHDQIKTSLDKLTDRSLIFINDISKIDLLNRDTCERKKLLALTHHLKTVGNHFVFMFYQSSGKSENNKLLRDAEFMSDAFIRVSSCKTGYFISSWYRILSPSRTLIPRTIENFYATCKIGESYWSKPNVELLCFHEEKRVAKDYDLENDTNLSEDKAQSLNSNDSGSSSDEEEVDKDSTLPYSEAQNPEKSRIFYYPDKDDDFDEDDPDSDLNI